MKRPSWVILQVLLLAALAFDATPTPPRMPPIPDRLNPPPTVYPPTQASLGAQVYYQVCMACHGDRGQGLTDEWRAALDPPDQNCWQSGCHHTRHPAGGFIFPRIVPAVVGPGMLARFTTALDLFNFIQEKMPYQAPASLSEAEYWQLTAFLISLNNIGYDSNDLSAQNAAAVRLAPLISTSVPATISVAQKLPGGLILAVGAIIILTLALGLVKYKDVQSRKDPPKTF